VTVIGPAPVPDPPWLKPLDIARPGVADEVDEDQYARERAYPSEFGEVDRGAGHQRPTGRSTVLA